MIVNRISFVPVSLPAQTKQAFLKTSVWMLGNDAMGIFFNYSTIFYEESIDRENNRQRSFEIHSCKTVKTSAEFSLFKKYLSSAIKFCSANSRYSTCKQYNISNRQIEIQSEPELQCTEYEDCRKNNKTVVFCLVYKRSFWNWQIIKKKYILAPV